MSVRKKLDRQRCWRRITRRNVVTAIEMIINRSPSVTVTNPLGFFFVIRYFVLRSPMLSPVNYQTQPSATGGDGA